jgi:hypothetical protein
VIATRVRGAPKNGAAKCAAWKREYRRNQQDSAVFLS